MKSRSPRRVPPVGSRVRVQKKNVSHVLNGVVVATWESGRDPIFGHDGLVAVQGYGVSVIGVTAAEVELIPGP